MERRFQVTHTAVGWWRSIDVRTIVDTVNMPGPIGSVLVASCGHYGQRAAKMGPDRICQIRLAASDPDLIWMAWSGFGQTDPVWKLAGVQESSGPLLANASSSIRTGCESEPACLLGNYRPSWIVHNMLPLRFSWKLNKSNTIVFCFVFRKVVTRVQNKVGYIIVLLCQLRMCTNILAFILLRDCLSFCM